MVLYYKRSHVPISDIHTGNTLLDTSLKLLECNLARHNLGVIQVQRKKRENKNGKRRKKKKKKRQLRERENNNVG